MRQKKSVLKKMVDATLVLAVVVFLLTVGFFMIFYRMENLVDSLESQQKQKTDGANMPQIDANNSNKQEDDDFEEDSDDDSDEDDSSDDDDYESDDEDEDDDDIAEMQIQVNDKTLADPQSQAYVRFVHPQYGFVAPITGHNTYLSVANNSMPLIPARLFHYALRNNLIQVYSRVFDYQPYYHNSPLYFRYRSRKRYWPRSSSRYLPWRRRRIYLRGRRYRRVPYNRYRRFRGRRLPNRSYRYGRFATRYRRGRRRRSRL